MREETFTKYIADDGFSFDSKTSCIYYEKLCDKYITWLRDGKVMFWDHAGNYVNFELSNLTCTEDANYLNLLKKYLSSSIGYILINEPPCGDGWSPIWEFVAEYCLFDKATIKKIESTYCEGDLLFFDPDDCRFHNIDLVARNAALTKDRLMKDLAHKAFDADKE